MEKSIYTIHCITNLHVGSGETEGIVEKSIQRDPITSRPVIHGSSLKGALREFCENEFEEKDQQKVIEIFGSDQKEKKNLKQGSFRFFSAHLISMPMRSSIQPYFNVTCPGAIKDLINLADNLGLTLKGKDALNTFAEMNPTDKAMVCGNNLNGRIEDFEVENKGNINGIEDIKQIVGEYPAIISDIQFTEMCKSELPVIARNCLDNGKSTNLWYEEIVPRESRFAFGVIRDDKKDNLQNTINDKIVQIGGNATVGYGFTKIVKLI